jgi:hypothetical protein
LGIISECPFVTGKPGTWLGKYHSEKTKQKISKINSGKIHTEKSRKI